MASAARPARLPFDPATTLSWAVPGLLLAPLVAYVLLLAGVRTRRAAASLSFVVTLAMLACTGLIAWARYRTAEPYRSTTQWINVPVAFTGDSRFQGFGIDIAFRVDHVALAALAAVLVMTAAAIIWHRVAGRGEPGPVRAQVNLLMLLFGAAGFIVSGDLAEALAFWVLAGVASYLLLGHRWGTEAGGRAGRAALSLPFLGDVALFCAVAILYSRYGLLDLDKLLPVLSTTPGVGQKSLTTVALLVAVAAAARAGLWPFSAWQAATAEAPPALAGLVVGVWPVLAGILLYRVQPLFGAAGIQAPRGAAVYFGLAAVLGTLLALIGTDLRRTLLLGTSGAAALGLLAVLSSATAAAGLAGLIAIGAGRQSAVLSTGALGTALRTLDMRDMGGAWQRMRLTSLSLGGGALAVVVAALAAVAAQPLSPAWPALAVSVALLALAVAGSWLVPSFSPLRRRRAFEPARVREVAPPVAAAALAVGALALVAAALALTPAGTRFLTGRYPAPSAVGTALTVVSAAAGVAVAALLLASPRRDLTLRRLGEVAEQVWARWRVVGTLYRRFLAAPTMGVMRGIEGRGLPAVDAAFGRALASTSRAADRSLPWAPTLLLLAAALTLGFALLNPGLRR